MVRRETLACHIEEFYMRELVRYLLENRQSLPAKDWTVQGFGFMRLRVADSVRVHIWDARLRQPGVSDIHDHTQWAFTSSVVSGQIINVRYTLDARGQPHHMATLTCGIGGGMHNNKPAELVTLLPGTPELYAPGMSYRQEPDEIHRTHAADGTVTLIRQERRQVDTARVFWPEGGSWGDAIPRQATRDEIDEVGGYALLIFGRDAALLKEAA
jgi:hypothetical protein